MSVDEQAGSILDLIVDCWTHVRDRAAIERTILAVADENDGYVDPNVVRKKIPTWVQPQVIGPTYRALCKAGVLTPDSWTTSDDVRGRNSGKPARTYRRIA